MVKRYECGHISTSHQLNYHDLVNGTRVKRHTYCKMLSCSCKVWREDVRKA